MVIVLMRGVPGIGKSTYVKKILPSIVGPCGGANYVICSADLFFVDEDGNYNFDRDKLGDAHRSCKQRFYRELHKPSGEQADVLVVDNTNSSLVELVFYYELAALLNYEVQIHELQGPEKNAVSGGWHKAIDKYVSRNLHGVPYAVIAKMSWSIESEKVPKWWGRAKLVKVNVKDNFFKVDDKEYLIEASE